MRSYKSYIGNYPNQSICYILDSVKILYVLEVLELIVLALLRKCWDKFLRQLIQHLAHGLE